jgi:hypothetical protein
METRQWDIYWYTKSAIQGGTALITIQKYVLNLNNFMKEESVWYNDKELFCEGGCLLVARQPGLAGREKSVSVSCHSLLPVHTFSRGFH